VKFLIDNNLSPLLADALKAAADAGKADTRAAMTAESTAVCDLQTAEGVVALPGSTAAGARD